MKTRNAGTPKSASAKKTPPARKSAGVGANVASPDAGTTSAAGKTTTPSKKSAVGPKMTSPEPKKESPAPSPTETALIPAIKSKKVKGNDSTPSANTVSKLESSVEEPKQSSEVVQVTPKKRVIRTVVRKVVRKKASNTSKASSIQSPKSEELMKPVAGESSEKKEVEAEKYMKSRNQRELASEVGESTNERQIAGEVEEPRAVIVGVSEKLEQPVVVKPKEHMDIEEHNIGVEEKVDKEEGVNEEIINDIDKVEQKAHPANVEDTPEGADEVCEDMHPCDYELEEHREEDLELGDADLVDHSAPDVHEEAGEKELSVDDVAKSSNEDEGFEQEYVELSAHSKEDDVTKPGDEAERLEEEHMELTAHAEERRVKKELEIFVSGLDRNVGEDDVKKAFEKVGEIVEVRLHKDLLNNRTKGHAVVKFANKEQASRALLEVKNPIIRGKRCGTAPSEENDTLFLGNICNTWTKEAIKQKMKDYGVEGVAHITLVADPRHEGKSRGFAFIEFSSHADAMLAYMRLQKPDVLFGHAERTAKVAFAEPIREPDPEIMAQVKSVFVDGLPPYWDEDNVKNQFRAFGEIEKIVLARNMSSAKRMDFGFVDFSTHEAAVACVDGINRTELIDGNSKIKVKTRLSNPLPKTQAVKGGMCGGFRIGQGGGTSLQQGRGFVLSQPSNGGNFQRGRGFLPHGQGHIGRMGLVREQDYDHLYPDFHGRQLFGQGGRRGGAARARYDRSGPSHDVIDGGRGRHFSSRRPSFPMEGGFGRPFVDGHFNDPYQYDDIPHGMKRPFYMTDPGYPEPSRYRPRLDYAQPARPFHESHYRDAGGMSSGMFSPDFYGPDYGGAYSSFYGADRSYRGGYY